MTQGIIPRHGGYRDLFSYRKAEIVYDATVWFCDRHIERRAPMMLAARSRRRS